MVKVPTCGEGQEESCREERREHGELLLLLLSDIN